MLNRTRLFLGVLAACSGTLFPLLSAQAQDAISSQAYMQMNQVQQQLNSGLITKVGYSGGTTKNPTYKEVCTDKTGHAETVEVDYDPTKVTYHKLLEVFFGNHDPTTSNRQGPDVGTQYRSVIFYTTPEQKQEALTYKDELDKSHRFSAPIVTEIVEAPKFYDAEAYHQNYFKKHGKVCN